MNLDLNITMWVATAFFVVFTVIFGILVRDGFKENKKSKVTEILIIVAWLVMLISVGMLWYLNFVLY